jgi:ureidoacrylate peracid hydrolase
MLTTLAEKVDPGHAALLVVDMQNDFAHEDGGLARNGGDVGPTQAIVPALNRLIGEARAAGTPVIFIRAAHSKWTNSPAGLEKRLGRRHPICVEGTWGCEFYGVAPEEGECVVTKHRYSAFINTDLDLILRAQGIETIIMTGTATNVCVESTARDGFMLDYYVVFLAECTATGDPELHESTLKNIGRAFGTVCASTDVIGEWAKTKVLQPAGV